MKEKFIVEDCLFINRFTEETVDQVKDKSNVIGEQRKTIVFVLPKFQSMQCLKI